MMRIGFTGTQKGMSPNQILDLKKALIMLPNLWTKDITFIHGGCIGADEEFNNIVHIFNKIEVYPGFSSKNPNDLSKRSTNLKGDIVYHEPKQFFVRNRLIVDASDYMIAAPYDDIQRGGTWYTINYAKSKNKKVLKLKR